MPVASELIAHGRSDEEVGELIGADRIVYQELEDLKAACRDVNPTLEEFDCSVFDGQYVTGDIDAAYLADLEAARNDLAKHRENTVHAVVDLHNDVEEDN